MKLKKTQSHQRNKIKIYSLRNIIFKDLMVCRNSYINFEINGMLMIININDRTS